MTSKKKVVGESKGKMMLQNRFQARAPSMAAGFEQRRRDRLQTGQKKQEVIGHLFPYCRHDDQGHGMIGVEQMVPGYAVLLQHIRHHAHRRSKHEQP